MDGGTLLPPGNGADNAAPSRKGIMNVFKTIISTPDKTAFDGEVDSLVVPGLDGFYGVMADHTPMISGVSAGILKMVRNGADEYLMVGEGLLRVESKTVHILVDAVVKTAGFGEAEIRLEEYLATHPAQTLSPAI